ncbi:MAG: undecaprenyl/decaprenyl-phosphate alpha-N-acetylglucosaminyl 1-phosphate transferase [Clostridia bacterium]|nr:undecaprenyl/decaprenyl-phosphate alpha-N-acetylglucosaminyl 1-phosphate transferase [Clostridia bacterium]
MNDIAIQIMFIFAVSFLLTFITTPLVKVLAIRFNVVDVPKDDRRMHKRPIPRMGGLAMFYGFIVSVIVFIKLDPELVGMLLGTLIIVAMGIIDDKFALKARIKFPIQIIAAIIPVLFGLTINFIKLPFFGMLVIPAPWSQIVTVLWIVAITNAVNLIDGLDGLAAGISSIASISMLFISLIMGGFESAFIATALVGCCLGFLPFNMNPAKIFMGDTGATFLGYVLAVLSVMGAFKSYAVISFVFPFLVLGLPIFDTLFAIIRRILKHKPIMSADRGHLHHRLIDMGFNQKQTVTILYSASCILGLSATVMAARGMVKGLILIAALSPVVVFVVWFAVKRKHEFKDKENENE